MPSTPSTAPKTRPATETEIAEILARADRVNPAGDVSDIALLLPPDYVADYKRRLVECGGMLGRHHAVEAAVSQLHEDARCGLLTVADSASE